MTAVQADMADPIAAMAAVRQQQDTPMAPGLRKLSAGGQENSAPGSRRVSGKDIFAAATSASPLKYGGRPVDHVPETPVAFAANNNCSP